MVTHKILFRKTEVNTFWKFIYIRQSYELYMTKHYVDVEDETTTL